MIWHTVNVSIEYVDADDIFLIDMDGVHSSISYTHVYDDIGDNILDMIAGFGWMRNIEDRDILRIVLV